MSTEKIPVEPLRVGRFKFLILDALGNSSHPVNRDFDIDADNALKVAEYVRNNLGLQPFPADRLPKGTVKMFQLADALHRLYLEQIASQKK